MLDNYVPILVFFVISILFGFGPMTLSFIIAPSDYSKEKHSQYECGFLPFSNSRAKFDVKFYLVAILFIIFDLEIAFLFPWAVVLKQLSLFGIIAMGLFLVVLTVGFIFEWKKGALEWE